MMAWFTLIVGGLVLVIGLFGQFFGIQRRSPTNAEDRRIGKVVLTIGSTVVGLWLVAFSVAHLLRLHTVGRW